MSTTEIFTVEEQKEFIRLMGKLTFPTSLPVFESWCRVFGTVCAEAVIVRGEGLHTEIFLVYREDDFFKGWHIPGCTHLPTEHIQETFNRVLSTEVKITPKSVSFFGWFERPYGDGPGESPRGHEFSFTFTVHAENAVDENVHACFFPLSQLPERIIANQFPIIDELKKKYLGSEK